MPWRKMVQGKALERDLRLSAVDPPEGTAGGSSERWPRGARILFILGAAGLCWAVPIAVLYLLFR